MNTKMLAAVAAVGCAFALNADVTSANIVGYVSQSSREGKNFVTPTFVAVDGGLLTAQDIQVPADVAKGDANIQVLDFEGLAPKGYQWFPASYFSVTVAGKAYTDDTYTVPFVLPEGKNGVWAVENNNGEKVASKKKYWYEVLNKDLAPADAVQVYTRNANVQMTTAGAVPDEDVVVTSIAGKNFVGNPFPAAITTQDIQLPADVAKGDANIQVLDFEGLAPKGYQWFPASYFSVTVAGKAYTDGTYTVPFTVPEGANGVWAVEYNNGEKVASKKKYWYEVLNNTLQPGESIQLYTRNAEVDISITCPYDLKADK